MLAFIGNGINGKSLGTSFDAVSIPQIIFGTLFLRFLLYFFYFEQDLLRQYL